MFSVTFLAKTRHKLCLLQGYSYCIIVSPNELYPNCRQNRDLLPHSPTFFLYLVGKMKYKGMKYDAEYFQKLRLKKQKQREDEKRQALEEEKRLKSEYDVRNISRPQNWKGMKYDVNEEEVKRAQRKREILERKRAAADLKKSGPRDEGRNKYKGLKYSEEEQERIRAQKREEEERRKREEAAADLAKLGPRDMGIFIYFHVFNLEVLA